jgi:dUTP pyrophosphatase
MAHSKARDEKRSSSRQPRDTTPKKLPTTGMRPEDPYRSLSGRSSPFEEQMDDYSNANLEYGNLVSNTRPTEHDSNLFNEEAEGSPDLLNEGPFILKYSKSPTPQNETEPFGEPIQQNLKTPSQPRRTTQAIRDFYNRRTSQPDLLGDSIHSEEEELPEDFITDAQKQQAIRERQEEIKRLEELDRLRKDLEENAIRNKRMADILKAEDAFKQDQLRRAANKAIQEAEIKKLKERMAEEMAKENQLIEQIMMADLKPKQPSSGTPFFPDLSPPEKPLKGTPGDPDDDPDSDPEDNDQDDDEEDGRNPPNEDENLRPQRRSPHFDPTYEHIQMPAPGKFDPSKDEVADWLFTVDSYYKIKDFPARKRVGYAALLLLGNARIWWKAKCRDQTEPTLWKDFQQELIKQFQKIDAEQTARTKLRHIRQITSVEQYIAEFTKLTYQISDLHEAEKCDRFKAGLKPKIQAELLRRNLPNDLIQLQKAAHTEDVLLFNAERLLRPDFKKNSDSRPKANQGGSNFKKPGGHRNFNAIDAKELTCFKCNKKGHISKDCKSGDTKKPFNKKKDIPIKNTTKMNQITIKIQKAAPSVKIPTQKTTGSAGGDLTPSESGVIERFATKKIPTGIMAEIPKGYVGQIHTRSSLLMKGLFITGIIDSDYRDEIFLIVRNNNPYPMEYVANGKAIAQLIIMPYESATYQEVPKIDSKTDRKGGFGSTDIGAISVHPGKIVFTGKIRGKPAEFLVDSGADGVFTGKNIAEELGLYLNHLKTPITITMANGEDSEITQVAKNTLYTIQGFQDKMDIYIMPTDHDQIILGNHWLDKINPAINWRKKEITINRDDQIHTLRVDNISSQDTVEKKLNFIMAKEDFKLDTDDRICLVQMEQNDVDDELGIDDKFYAQRREEVDDPDLDALIEEYDDIFRDELPSGKPTTRNVEHIISLEDNTTPIQARQFRLSPNHIKTIQETVAELLRLGHIEPSR